MGDSADPLNIVGTVIDGKYRIEALAGDGGFSAVYRAEHLVWKEPAAIKFFTALSETSEDVRDELLNDFVQEGKLMTKLSSRSAAIVQAREIGKLDFDDGRWFPYMVLEWLDGQPLDNVIWTERQQGLPPRTLEQAMRLMSSAAEALHEAHGQNVAHRDLKPANIMCLGDPRDPKTKVKVLDFGIAKVMAGHEQLQEQLKKTGQEITSFTPHYGAPEQFSRGYGATGPWTDVYATALILVELLTGERALQGATVFDLGASSCNEAVRPTPSAKGVALPAEIESVFARALAIDVGQRYSNMAEFWLALHRAHALPPPSWLGPLSAGAVGEPASGLAARESGVDTSGPTVNALAKSVVVAGGRSNPSVFGPVLAVAAVMALAVGGALVMGVFSDGENELGVTSPSAPSVTVPAAAGSTEPDDATSPSAAVDESERVPAVSPSGDSEARPVGSSVKVAPNASAPSVDKDSSRSKAKKGTALSSKRPVKRTSGSGDTGAGKAAPKAGGKPKAGSNAWDPNSFGGR